MSILSGGPTPEERLAALERPTADSTVNLSLRQPEVEAGLRDVTGAIEDMRRTMALAIADLREQVVAAVNDAAEDRAELEAMQAIRTQEAMSVKQIVSALVALRAQVAAIKVSPQVTVEMPKLVGRTVRRDTEGNVIGTIEHYDGSQDAAVTIKEQ